MSEFLELTYDKFIFRVKTDCLYGRDDYKNKVEWRGGHLGHTWTSNGVELPFSAPPALHGMRNVLTPEDAFVASSNTCYFLMVVWAAERFKLDLVSLEIDAEGEVEEFLDRTSVFKQVTLRPRIVVRGKSKEVVQRALDMAMKYSTINQSFKSRVVIEPDILIQPAGPKEL